MRFKILAIMQLFTLQAQALCFNSLCALSGMHVREAKLLDSTVCAWEAVICIRKNKCACVEAKLLQVLRHQFHICVEQLRLLQF